MGDNKKERSKIFNKINRKLNIFRAKYRVAYKKRKFYKNVGIFCIRLIPSIILQKKALVNKIDEMCKIYDFDNSIYAGNYLGAWGEREIMKREWFGVPTPMQFEDMQINVPEFYGEYLTKLYGDYMTPPPKEKQITHHDYIYENLNEPYIK